jgi:hypothetical protein
MSNKLSVRKTVSLAYAAVAAFTAISVIVPILWEKKARREDKVTSS